MVVCGWCAKYDVDLDKKGGSTEDFFQLLRLCLASLFVGFVDLDQKYMEQLNVGRR